MAIPRCDANGTIDSENFQWDLPIGPVGSTRRHRREPSGAATLAQERAAIALIVEVTSQTSADTVYNDRVVKPRQYAKAGIRCTFVEQE